MRIEVFDDAKTFYEFAGAWLLEAEAENCNILSIIESWIAPVRSETGPTFLAAVNSVGGYECAAVFGRRQNLLISDASNSAIDALVDYLVDRGVRCSEVFSSVDVATRFVTAWQIQIECTAQLIMNIRQFQCDKVVWPPRCPGNWRCAVQDDFEQLVMWQQVFVGEALRKDMPLEKARDTVTGQIEDERAYVWENDRRVSMVICAGETANGGGINQVFTPKEERGRGYASNLTAAVTNLLLNERAKRFSVLFTDQANETSNDVYMRIGYRPIRDWQHGTFTYPSS
jgi:uncharacterized protein